MLQMNAPGITGASRQRPEPPDPVEIIQHGVAEARHVRPEISGAERRARQQFRIVGLKFEADVERLFDIGGLSRIERLAAEPYIASVAARAAERSGRADRSRGGEEA